MIRGRWRGRWDADLAGSSDTSTRGSRERGLNELTVVFIPDMRSTNRYQALLAAALERRQIKVLFPEQFGRRRPLLTALLSRHFDVLHLDWVHLYLVAGSLPRSILRSLIFVLKVWLVRISGRRIVWTAHNIVSHEARFPGWESRVNRVLARLVHALVVHYPDARQIVREEFRVPAGKEISVAHHGHYVEAYGSTIARRPLESMQTSRRPLVFLAFGLVRRYKRLEDLMTAFKSLGRGDVHLRIAGHALEQEYAEKLRGLAGEDESISLDFGFVDDSMVAEVFAAADVAAVTQADTLTSGSLILAMSMAMPVVAARTPHAEFLLGGGQEGGLLYAPGSATQLADALQQMVDRRDDLAEMGLANHQRITEHTWSRMAEEMERAYRDKGLEPARPRLG